MILRYDEMMGIKYKSYDIQNPTWNDVLTQLSRLDGKTVTLVSYGVDADNYLMGGGGDGGYILCRSDGPDQLFEWYDPCKGNSTVYIMAGGQVGDFRESQLAPYEIVRQEFEEYYRTGRTCTRYWKEA